MSRFKVFESSVEVSIPDGTAISSETATVIAHCDIAHQLRRIATALEHIEHQLENNDLKVHITQP